MDFSIYYFIIWYECRKLKRNMIHERKRRFSPLLLTFLLLKLLRCHFSGRTFCNVNYLPSYQPAHLSISTFLDSKTDVIPDVSTQCTWIKKKICNMTKFFLFLKNKWRKQKLRCWLMLTEAEIFFIWLYLIRGEHNSSHINFFRRYWILEKGVK